MSRREFIGILLAAIVLTIAVPRVVQLFKPGQAGPEPLPGVPFSTPVEPFSPKPEVLGKVRGRCLESLGRTPVEALVTVNDASGKPVVTWTCDKEGRFEFSFRPAQSSSIEIWNSRYVSQRIALAKFNGNDAVDVGTILLEPLCEFTFFVTEFGKRVAPKELTLTRLYPLPQNGDENEQKSVPIPLQGLPSSRLTPGIWRAIVPHKNARISNGLWFAPDLSRTFEVTQTEGDIELVPQAKGTSRLEVTVANHRGERLSNVPVYLETLGPPEISGVVQMQKTGDSGTAAFADVAKGIYRVSAFEGSNMENKFSSVLDIAEGAVLTSSIVANSLSDVLVTVAKHGEPWEGAAVALVENEHRFAMDEPLQRDGSTNESGTFLFSKVPPGEYTLRARARWADLPYAAFEDITVVVSPNRDARLGLEVSRSLAATVKCFAGGRSAFGPLDTKNLVFCLVNEASPEQCSLRQADVEGNASFESVPLGPYRLWAMVSMGSYERWIGDVPHRFRLWGGNRCLTQSAKLDVSTAGEVLECGFEFAPIAPNAKVFLRQDGEEFPFYGQGNLYLIQQGAGNNPLLHGIENSAVSTQVSKGEVSLPWTESGQYFAALYTGSSLIGSCTLEIPMVGQDSRFVLDATADAELEVNLKSVDETPILPNGGFIALRSEWGDQRVFVEPKQSMRFLFLLPGTYSLKFVGPGYEPATLSGITVSSGRRQSVSLSLKSNVSQAVLTLDGIEPRELVEAIAVVFDGRGNAVTTTHRCVQYEGTYALLVNEIPQHAARVTIFVPGRPAFRSELQPTAGKLMVVRQKLEPR